MRQITKDTLSTIGIVILLFTIVVGALIFFDKRDKELMGWAEAYEECVKENYGGTTPWEYRNLHGEYPKCDTTEYQKVELLY